MWLVMRNRELFLDPENSVEPIEILLNNSVNYLHEPFNSLTESGQVRNIATNS